MKEKSLYKCPNCETCFDKESIKNLLKIYKERESYSTDPKTVLYLRKLIYSLYILIREPSEMMKSQNITDNQGE